MDKKAENGTGKEMSRTERERRKKEILKGDEIVRLIFFFPPAFSFLHSLLQMLILMVMMMVEGDQQGARKTESIQ